MNDGTSSTLDTSGDGRDDDVSYRPRLVLLPRLRPAVPPQPHVDRPRLRQLLDQGVAGSLTMVSAPAGWGKTVAVASWAEFRSAQMPVCWLEIDPATSTTTSTNASTNASTAAGPTLWEQLHAALSTVDPSLNGSFGGFSADAADRDTARRAFVNAAARLVAPVVLVVDDVHRLVDPTDVADLAMLVGLPTQLRLVLVGRGTRLPLHRVRTEGQLTEIGASALAFTTAESAQLLDAFGVPTADDLAGRLARATEGWVAGLRLSAAACAAHAAGAASGLTREIADYLEAEVFAPLPASVREFLVRTSVLDRVNGPLADAVAPSDSETDGATLLAGLARSHGFVVGDGSDPDWYRYHAMFAAFLRTKLGRDVDEDSSELHLRAALWCAANFRAADAVRHAQQASDWTYAACLLVYGPFPTFADDAFGSFGALADATPTEVARQCPETAVTVALRLVRAGEVAPAGKCLDWARSQLVKLPAARRRPLSHAVDVVELRRAELAAAPTAMLDAARHLLRACGSDLDGIDADVSDRPELTVGRVPGWHGSAAVRTAQLRTLAIVARGRAELWRGRAEPAADNLRAAARLARTSGLPGARTSCLGGLSLLEAARGRLRAAQAHAFEALEQLAGDPELAEVGVSEVGVAEVGVGLVGDELAADGVVAAGASAPGWREAQLALAVVAYQRDDFVAARGRLALATASDGRRGADPQLAALAAVVRMRVELAGGDVAAARAVRRQLSASDVHGWEGCDLVLAALRAFDVDLLVALGNPKAALDSSRRDVGSVRADPVVVLATARARLAVGDHASAAAMLARLLRADAGVGVSGVVTACVLDAVCAARGADDGRSTASLARALALAVDEGLIAPFLDAGDEVTELLSVHPSLRAAHPDFTRSIFAGRSAKNTLSTAETTARLVLPARAVGGAWPTPPAELGHRVGAGDLPADLASDVAAVRPPAPRRTPDGSDLDVTWPGTAHGQAGLVARGQGDLRGHDDFRGHGAVSGSGAAESAVRPVTEHLAERHLAERHLTEREQAVLSYLPTMLTTAEIAAEMFLSVNTVKTHLKSIYRKLDVARRRDAVHRARELRLL